MLKETKNWIDSSDYDFKTAEHMLQIERYIYVIFMCHISIEKLLKALVHETTGKLPPKTHDLIYLLRIADVHMPENFLEFIGKVNSASVVTRYPEDLLKIINAYPKAVAKEYFDNTREVLNWLRQAIDVIIKKYKEALAVLGVKAEKIILYGSYAQDIAREDSDIDLIIISSDFEGKNIRERLELLGIASARIMEPVQALGLTPEEIDSHEKSSFIKEVLEYGKAAA